MRSTASPLVGIVVSAILLATGAYMRTGQGQNTVLMGTVFMVVGGLGIITNILIWRTNRR